MSYWRDISRKTIAGVIKRVGRDDPVLLKRELFDAYPFVERKYYPYKIWLDEMKKQLPAKGHPPGEEQLPLFGDK